MGAEKIIICLKCGAYAEWGIHETFHTAMRGALKELTALVDQQQRRIESLESPNVAPGGIGD